MENVGAEPLHMAEAEQPVEADAELGRDGRDRVGARQPVHVAGEQLGERGPVYARPARERRPGQSGPRQRLREAQAEQAGDFSSVHEPLPQNLWIL